MLTLIKQDVSQDLKAAAQSVLQLFMPQLGDEDRAELGQMRKALRQAEVVITAQEERIRSLEAMAMTDELTGLANRRAFAAVFERELALARRDANCGGVVVMVDLDRFKAINDKWGHQAGDVYLKAVAEVLREEMRASDIVARIGGDEFAVLLTHMDEQAGAKRLAKLQENFEKRAAVVPEIVPLRASFGFAAYTGSDSVEAVMRLADQRLYLCKVGART